jgi:spermidine synthase
VTEASSSDASTPWALYGIFAVSGCAALVYEVMWARCFGVVFGSSTRAAAVVLAAYFLGMALGNALGGRFAVRTRAAALRCYAWVELAVAAAALAVLPWLALYRALYPALYRATSEAPGGLTAVQLGLAALALAPPCIGLGATLPLMSRAVVASEVHLGRRLSLVYALNTIGGVVGVIVSGFWLPVAIGVRGSLLAAAALNVGAAIAALVAARGLAAAAVAPLLPASAGAGDRRGAGLPIAVVAAASGFGTLALEVLFTNLLVNATDSSVFSFALMIATFLISLALGSTLVSALVDRLGSAWTLIAASSALGAVAVLLAPAFSTRVWLDAAWLNGPLVFLPVVLAVVAPAAVCVGVVLPATWIAAIGAVETSGALVGRLTSLNTLAGVAGALAAGFVLIPALGVSGSVLLVAGLYAAVAMLALLVAGSRSRRILALGVALAFVGFASLRTWQIVPVFVPSGYHVASIDESEGATIAIIENEHRVRYLILNSRYALGGSTGVDVHRSQGELALALRGAARDVAFIGVATGMSVSAIYAHPEVERVVAMELLPGVVRLAQEFREENGGVLGDPRVELRLADGRNHLFGSNQRFDAIVGDLFIPWHAGTGSLYTVEHFENVHERLRAGGVFVQWLQLDQVSPQELGSLVATFTAAFDDAELWLNSTQRERPLLALVGYRGRTGAGPEQVGKMRRICGAEPLRVWSAGAPLNTDDFPFIEFSAGMSHHRPAAARTRDVSAAVEWLRAEERRRPARGS